MKTAKQILIELLESPSLSNKSLDSDCESERKAIVRKLKKAIKLLTAPKPRKYANGVPNHIRCPANDYLNTKESES
jgi:hypothetical protein